MIDYNYIIIIIIICALITFSTRLFPFVLFSKREMPKFIKSLSEDLPQAIIAILIVYCLKDIQTYSTIEIIFVFIAIILVITSYLLKKSILISIGLGTIVYMLLLYLFI